MNFSFKNYLKYFVFAILVFITLSAIVFLLSYLIVNSASGKYIYKDADKLPHAQVAIIPGAAILINGNLSPVLRDRVDMAIEIYKKGIVDKVLVTGNNSSVDYNEVIPMKKYLVKNGVPEQDIFTDYAGFDTYSSMYRARDIFKVSSMIVVSQAFHLPRAVYIARHLGLIAYGMEADRGNYLLRNDVREIFGNVKALSDLFFKRQPKYLGEQIPITGDNTIRVDEPISNVLVQSPLTIKGSARGTWFFEASFPIKIFDSNGKQLGVAVAQAQSDWMTMDFVPFIATLIFDKPTTEKGTVVFQKDNPSGLSENDRSFSVSVHFLNNASKL